MLVGSRHNSLILALFLILFAVTVAGQSPTTGKIEGTVKDPKGARIAGADVRAVSKSRGEERVSITDEAGQFAFPLLPSGSYLVTVSARGFANASYEASVVTTQTTQLDLKLILSGPDTVTVTVGSLIQTDGPQLGRAVDGRFISDLPLASRNFSQILTLSPGVATYLPDNSGVGRNTQTVSINGARPTQNNVQVNGIDGNTMGTNAAVNIAVPAPETIQEVKVQTSLYDASFGRSGGGNIQVVTRSGEKDFHGALYEYFRTDALNANNPYLKAAGLRRPILRRDAFGGTLGGAIRREKAFLFVSYQGTREKNGASILNSISSGVLVDPNLTNDRSEATLKRTYSLPTINPVALALLNAKLPDRRFVIPTPQSNGRYSDSSISRFSENQFNANFDLSLSTRNRTAVKFFFANGPLFLALPSFRGTGANVPGFGASEARNVRVLSIQNVHGFSSRTFNELRSGFNRHANLISPSEPVNDSDLGLTRSTADAFPGLGLIRIAPAAGGVVVGTPTNISPAFGWVATLADTLSMTRGNKAIRVGGEFRFNEVDLAQQQFTRGQIDFTDFRNFLLGTSLNSTLGNGIGDRKQRALDYNFFFQNDWQVRNGLTLNLGLRYELDLPPYDTRGRVSTFDPSLYRPRLQVGPDGLPVGPPLSGFVQAGNVLAQYDLPTVANVSKYVVNSIDPNNVAPRIGSAYSLTDRSVLRAGYGVFYSRSTFQYVSTSVTVPPGYLLAGTANRPFGNPFFPVPAQDEFPIFVPGVSLSGTVPDGAILTPYFHQYNVSFQHQFDVHSVFEMAFVGTQGRNLFRQMAINQARLASLQQPIVNEVTGATITTNTPANAALRAPFQGVDINSFFQNQTTARSSYKSLQLSFTRQTTANWQVLVSYTYAKAIDNASGTGGGAGIVGIVNPSSVGDTSLSLGDQRSDSANRGVADFDRTHRLVVSSLWRVPKPFDTRDGTLKGLLLSHWQLNGIIVAMSGLPIDIVDTGAGSLYGLANGANPLARPNWAPGATRSTATADVPRGYFFNPFAFARPVVAVGQLIPSSNGAALAGAAGTDVGNVGRNVLRGPVQANVDLGVVKYFPLDESKDIEFRTEVFNLFNHVNLANPISNLTAVTSAGGSFDPATGRIVMPGDFGRIVSTSNNPRMIQFALKLKF